VECQRRSVRRVYGGGDPVGPAGQRGGGAGREALKGPADAAGSADIQFVLYVFNDLQEAYPGRIFLSQDRRIYFRPIFSHLPISIAGSH
jgi:hypothetical protein